MALKITKSIFYHIPKTGGTWTWKTISLLKIGDGKERYLDEIKYPKHPEGLKKKHTIPEDIEEEEKKGLFSFCFVRHPINWYKSAWNFRINRYKGSKMKYGKLDNRASIDDCFWCDTFEEFIIKTMKKFSNGYVTTLYQYYVKEDLSGVDFIGRQENLRKDFIKALILGGESFNEKEIMNFKEQNISSNKKNKLKLSKELEMELIEREKWVINNFYK